MRGIVLVRWFPDSIPFACLIQIGAWLLVIWSPPLHGQSELETRFRTEAPLAYEAFQNQIPRDFSGSYRQSDEGIVTSTGAIIDKRTELKFFRRGRMRLYEHSIITDGISKPVNATAINDRYQFSLHSNGVEPIKWTVAFLGFDVAAPRDALLLLPERGQAWIPYFVPLDIVYNNPPGMTLTAVTSETFDGRQMVRVTYDCDFAPPNDRLRVDNIPVNGRWMTSLTLLLDPENYWLPVNGVQRKSTTTGEAHDHTMSWEYAKTNGIVHCRKLTTEDVWNDGSGVTTWSDISYDFEKVPRKRFFISWYGLAEPPGANRVWWVVALLGSIGIVLTVTLRLLRKKG